MSFDYTTHRRNSKGKIVELMPYRMRITKDGVRLERPPGSGEFFNPDGSPVVEAVIIKEGKSEAVIEVMKPKLMGAVSGNKNKDL